MKACEDVNDSPGDVILDLSGTSLPSTSSTSIPCSSRRLTRPQTFFLSGNELNENMIVRVQERFDAVCFDGCFVPETTGLPNTTLNEVKMHSEQSFPYLSLLPFCHDLNIGEELQALLFECVRTVDVNTPTSAHTKWLLATTRFYDSELRRKKTLRPIWTVEHHQRRRQCESFI